jgi:serine/threonine protein kinase
MGISHRDLKPENIFIAHEFEDGRDKTIFKIGDFGFAAQKQNFNEVMGTYPFMAPEIFRR